MQIFLEVLRLCFIGPSCTVTMNGLFTECHFPSYDQGVMSQVNLNERYQKPMGISAVEGNLDRHSNSTETKLTSESKFQKCSCFGWDSRSILRRNPHRSPSRRFINRSVGTHQSCCLRFFLGSARCCSTGFCVQHRLNVLCPCDCWCWSGCYRLCDSGVVSRSQQSPS